MWELYNTPSILFVVASATALYIDIVNMFNIIADIAMS